MIGIKIFFFIVALLIMLIGVVGILENEYNHKSSTVSIIVIICGILLMGVLIFV